MFIDNNMAAFLQQQGYWKEVMEMPVNVMAGGFESGYYYDGDYTYDIADDYCVSWPVYPSFKNTMEVLKKQSVVPGSYMTAKNIQSIRIDLQSLYVGEEGAIRLPQGDELEKLKEENPHYSEQGRLDITDSEEIEAAEGSEEASDELSEEQEEFSGQEADEIPLASGVENLSSGSMKLQAQEQQDKEEEETYQEAEEAEAEKATEMSLSQSVAEIMKEKAAGNEESEEKSAGVPLNEEGKPDFSATIRMPELKIPKSMINVDPENASSSAEIPDASGIFGSIEEIAASVGDRSGKDKDKDFNLEDTILAAATQQGIDIPEEEKSPDVQQSDVTEEPAGIEDLDIAADEFVPEEPDAADIEDIMAQISAQQEEEVTETSDTRIPDIVFDEDEEPVTEEDLQAAEAEFLNGPSGVQKPVEEEDVLPEIPSLESEEQVQKSAAEPSAKLHHEEPVAAAEEENLLDEEEEYSDDAFDFQEEDDFISSLIGDDSDEAMEEDDEEEELSEEEQLEKFIATIHPEKDPTKIVSRKKELTDEEKKLFTYFVTVPGMKEQLLDVLCDVQMGAADKTSQTGNVIVMGGRETGKTRLISSLIPAICKELNIEASKVAYIFADDLNGKDIPEIVSKLAGGFLVIEDANQLSQETADELEEAMTGNTKGMIVILEDEKIGMRKLIARYPKLAKKFTSMINIPVFTNDELVNFAKVYTMENGFRIDQMGMLALYNLIGINQKEDQPMCIGTVKTMLDKAMERAQSGLFKRSKKRVDRDGYTVLFEKDFS